MARPLIPRLFTAVKLYQNVVAKNGAKFFWAGHPREVSHAACSMITREGRTEDGEYPSPKRISANIALPPLFRRPHKNTVCSNTLPTYQNSTLPFSCLCSALYADDP